PDMGGGERWGYSSRGATKSSRGEGGDDDATVLPTADRASYQAALLFLTGKGFLNDNARIGLYQALILPARVNLVLEAAGKGAALAAGLPTAGRTLADLVNDPAFEWTPRPIPIGNPSSGGETIDVVVGGAIAPRSSAVSVVPGTRQTEHRDAALSSTQPLGP